MNANDCPLTIAKLYRVAFDIDDYSDKRASLLRFCDRVQAIAKAKKYDALHIDETGGGASWNAYMIVTHSNRRTLAQFIRQLPRAARAACVTLNDWEASR